MRCSSKHAVASRKSIIVGYPICWHRASACLANVAAVAIKLELNKKRMLWIKVEIVKLNQTEVISDLLKSTFDKADRLGSDLNRIFRARSEAQSWASDAETQMSIDLKLTEKGHDPHSVLAQAYLRGAGEI